MSDHYSTLGVSKDASPEEIKKAYRKKARQLHPDVNPSEEAAEEFKRVTLAYEVLSDNEKRRNYDATGDEQGRAGFPGGAGGFGGFGSGSFGFQDLFDMFTGGGGQSGPASRVRQGQDALIIVSISLKDAVFGVEKTVELNTAVTCKSCEGEGTAPGTHPETCETCHGQGFMQRRVQSILGTVMQQVECPSCQGYGTVIKHRCPECHGQGRVGEKLPLTFTVPAGVNDGARIRLRGKGEAGLNGGPNGDLYIDLNVKRDKYFVRDGDNLTTTVNIPMVAAVLGTTVPLETFDGVQEITIPEGAQSGDIVTLNGLGVTRLHSDKRGDLQVRIQVTTPTNVNSEQRELLQKFAELRGEDLHEGTHVKQKHGLFSRLKDQFK